MAKDFDFPDTMPSKESRYATYIPARHPAFKVHSNEGLAHSAMGQRNLNEPYAKYEFENGQWVKVFEYQPPGADDPCSYCGEPYGRDQWGRIDLNESMADTPKWKRKAICGKCSKYQREQARREQQEERDRRELARLQKIYNNK